MAHLLSGQYELTALIGRGPTGEVWRGVDHNTRETVAVKMLDARLGADPGTVDRFVREQHVLTAFLHPTYVRVRDVITGGGVIALVMEFVTGWDVTRHLAHGGPLETSVAVDVAAAVAEALAAAHEAGVVHCELKPSNLLLEDSTGEVRLTDCRVSRLTRSYQGPAAWYADPEYAAPEAIRGGPPLPATDVYGLGIVLYEMLTGTTPYRAADPAEVLAGHLRGEPWVPPTVPEPLRRIIEDCLAGEPMARPSAGAVALRLRQAGAAPAGARPEPAEPPPAWSAPSPPGNDLIAASSGGPAHPGAPAPPGGLASSSAPAPPGGLASSGGPAPPGSPARAPGPRLLGLRAAVVSGVALVLVAAVFAVWLLSSSAGPRPDPVGPGVAAATPTGTIGPIATSRTSPPQPPPSATPATMEGAQAFVHHWFEALSYAIGTGDTAALEQASSPACVTCLQAVAFVRRSYEDGGTLRGGGYTVRTVSADDFWSVNSPKLNCVFDRTPRSVVAGGEQRDVFPGGNFLTCQVVLERVDDRWRVLAMNSPARLV